MYIHTHLATWLPKHIGKLIDYLCIPQTSTISAREQCKRETVDIYPHPDNCNYYYYCQNGFLLLQQCPFFYGWDYVKRSCVAINQAKCYGRRL